MENVKFAAKVAHASKEEGFYMVGFADDDEGAGQYILLQGGPETDAQDAVLGMDGEYAEWNGRQHAGYNRCQRAVLSPETFVAEFHFNNGQTHRVEVALQAVSIGEDLKKYLAEILGPKLEFSGF